MKTILVPTDFSKNAYAALHYAVQHLNNIECRFIILHSFEEQVTHLTSRIDIAKTEGVVEELYNSSERKCEEVKHQIIGDSENNKHSFEIIVTSLSLTRAINTIIGKEDVSFVIMSNKGQTAAESIFMGSNTLAAIRKIKKASLLIVPREMEYRDIKKIAFVTGFKRSYSRTEMAPLLFITSQNKSNLRVLHMNEKDKLSNTQRENFHMLFDILKEGRPEAHFLSSGTEKYEAVTTFINDDGIDLLAMVYYKHNFLAGLFREAVVKNLAKNINIPFLVMPAID